MARQWPALVAYRAFCAGYRRRLPVAGRAALCIALPLAIGVVSGHVAQGAVAATGGLAGLYVPESPYRYRARVVAAIGCCVAVGVLLGGLVSGNAWLVVPLVGVFAGLMAFGCQAAQLPPPRELMPILALLMATGVPVSPGEALERAGLTAGGAALAWLVCLTPALGRPRGPEERAVANAFTAIANLLDAVGSDASAVRRRQAVLAVRQARAAVGQGGARKGAREGVREGARLARLAVAAETLLEAAVHVEFEASGPVEGEWSAAVRSLAAGTPPPDLGSDGALAEAIAGARTVLAGGTVPGEAGLSTPPGFGAQLRAAARRHSVVVPSALRLAIAVAAGVGIGRAFGLSHAYWVGLSATAALQGSNLLLVRRRVVHRLAGTALGVCLTVAVLGWGPPAWLAALTIVLAQGLVELVVPFHYGVAVIGITVLSLSLFHLGAPGQDVAAALGARLLDTLIGVILALVLRHVLWPRTASAKLPLVQAWTLTAIRATFATAWQCPAEVANSRRRLQGELIALRALHEDALADAGEPGDPRWSTTVALEELAFLALALPADRPVPPPETAGAFLGYLSQFADALRSGTAVPAVVPPTLPGLPRTSAAVSALASPAA